MLTRQNLMLSAISAINLIALGACTDSTQGQADQLEFSYGSNNTRVDQPIAVGAKLKLSVRDLDDAAIIINEVQNDDEEVLKVRLSEDNQIIVEATGEGRARLSVTATRRDSKESITDTIELAARVPEVITVSHPCEDLAETEGYYLKGQTIELPFKAQLKDGQDLIGEGYSPIKLDGAPAQLNLVDFVGAKLKISIGDEASQVKLTSDFDASLSRSLNIVSAEQIDGARLELKTPANLAGDHGFAIIRPAIAGRSICQTPLQFTLTTLTPELCEVRTYAELLETTQEDLEGLVFDGEFGWIDIKGKAVGECKFTVTYPQRGASAELKVVITAQ